MAGKPQPRRPIRERFEEKVDRSAGPDACHPWLGPFSKRKPVFSIDKSNVSPRRLIWLWTHGEEPQADRRVWVTCGLQACMNPAHLRCQTYEEHFWSLVDKSGGPDACWPWTAARLKGYGHFWRDGGRRAAHRVAYEYGNGPIPESDVEILVMHSCDNPPCCNPKHLSLGTDRDNIHDMLAKGRAGFQKARRGSQSSGATRGGTDGSGE